MPQATVNIERELSNPGRIVSIQYQDSNTGEWKSLPHSSDLKGFTIDPTPTDYTINTSHEPLTAIFSFTSTFTDHRWSIDLVASGMSRRHVAIWEFLNQYAGKANWYWKCYAEQYNHSHRGRKVSARRLNWQQKARAIVMGELCEWW